MLKKLVKLHTIIFFFIIFINNSFAEIVKKIEIIGNDRISTDTIILFSDATLNKEMNNVELNNLTRKLYDTNYFENVKVSFTNGLLKIIVVENPIIGQISFEGIKAKKIKEQIEDSINLRARSSFDKITLSKDKEKIYQILKDLGYYFATIEIYSENKSRNIVDIIFDIKLGKKTKIGKITFTGNKFFKDKKLKSIIISEEYKPWKFISGRKYLKEETVSLDKRLLKNFYLNKGFYDVVINSSFAKLDNKNNFELIFNINSNNLYYFDNLNLKLPTDFNEDNYVEISKLFKDLKNKPYSINRIEKILNLIDRISTNDQFESTKSTVNESIIDNKINLEFIVEETERVIVKKINILGNNVTQENVLRNQLEIDEGDPYNEILAVRSINNIRSLNFFRTVDLDVVDDKQNAFKEMNISVTEKPTGEIMAGAGVGTSGATIAAGVKENNYLGKGVGLEANLTLSEDSIKGLFAVNNPNFNNSDKSINASVQATEINKLTDFGYKTSKTGFSIGTGFEYYNDLNLNLGFNTFYEKVEADSKASARQKKQAGSYFDTFLNFKFKYDKRDQKFQPSDGFISNYSVDLPIISDSSTLINRYDFSNYFQYFNKNVLKTSVFFQSSNSLTGDNVKLSERNYIPSKKLRGFEYGKIGPKDGKDYIGGNFVSSLNISSTIPQILENIQSTDFTIFLDVANMWGVDYDSSLDDADEIRSSIGVGLDWFSPVGPVNFSLAQPLSKGDSDKTETFRFNLGTTF